MLRDHAPIRLDNLKGLWSRGELEDVPLDHLSEANNLQYFGNGSFKTRDGLGRHQSVAAPLANVLRIYPYITDNGQTQLVLTAGGSIYHVVNTTTIYGPILTIPTMTDFGFVAFGGRAYITPFTTEVAGLFNRERGLNGQFLYVYKGDGTAARKAGGTTPTTTVTVANGAAGYTDGGVHIFGVVIETDTGYLTPPGGLVAFTTSDNLSVSFSTVQTSPDSFAVKRHLVASKVIQASEYNGDVNGYDLFFIPDAVIPNNVGTTLSDISFYDSALLDDATYLKDNYAEIPAGVNLFIYDKRLCLCTPYANPHIVLVSAQGQPEAISQISGLLETPKDGNYVTNLAELRDVLYVFKRSSTVAFVGNSDSDPTEWPMSSVDPAMGCGVHGIGTVLDTGSSNVDFLVVGTYTGIVLFNGRYILPELSWKIQDVWAAQDFKTKNRVIQIIHDSVKKIIYCVMTDNSILYGEYSNGFDPKNIRWCPWTFDVKVNGICLVNISELLLACDQAV